MTTSASEKPGNVYAYFGEDWAKVLRGTWKGMLIRTLIMAEKIKQILNWRYTFCCRLCWWCVRWQQKRGNKTEVNNTNEEQTWVPHEVSVSLSTLLPLCLTQGFWKKSFVFSSHGSKVMFQNADCLIMPPSVGTRVDPSRRVQGFWRS